MNMIPINADGLVRLAYKHPCLRSNWYIFASTVLTVVNQPQELGKVLHFALRQQLLEGPSLSDNSLLTNAYLLKLAEDSISSAAEFRELSETGVDLPDVLPTSRYPDELPFGFEYTNSEDISEAQLLVAKKIRESILKIAPISGLPKSIMALTALKMSTPSTLKPSALAERSQWVVPGHANSSKPVFENAASRSTKTNSNQIFETIEGRISLSSVSNDAILRNAIEGSDFWSLIYGKIKGRVRRQLIDAYPDLWQYAYQSVYGSILSYTKVLNARETSLCVLCALIPQDVNPILKGHLKGAENVGASKEEIENCRQLTLDICDWSGNVACKSGRKSDEKL